MIWTKKIEKKLFLDTPAAPSISESFYIGSSLNFLLKIDKKLQNAISGPKIIIQLYMNHVYKPKNIYFNVFESIFIPKYIWGRF